MPQTLSKVSERNRASGSTQPSYNFSHQQSLLSENQVDYCFTSDVLMAARYNSQMPDITPRCQIQLLDGCQKVLKQTYCGDAPQFVRYTATRCHMIAGNSKVLSWLPERGEANRVGRLTPGAKIPQNSKLESARSPVPSHRTVGGGGVTKKGDRGYIRLIPRYNSSPPAEPSHHTQKISIVPLRITYADNPCIVLYLLPPKSPS